MIKNSYLKNTLKIFALCLLLLSLNFSVAADEFGCSSNYCLDFGGVTFGSENYTSSSFENQNGPAPIETNSYSTNYQIMTINLLPLLNCGNGIRETGEQCDGSDLNGKTCADYGYDSGTISCGATCNFDISACYNEPVTPPPTPTPTPTPPPTDGVPLPVKNPEDQEPDDGPEVIKIIPKDPDEEPTTPETPEIPEEVPEPITIVSAPDYWEIPVQIVPEPVYLEPEPPVVEDEPEWIGIIDDTLFVADELEPETNYQLIITDPTGKVEHTEMITTDESGNFVFEYETLLEDGDYVINVNSRETGTSKNYHFQLRERDSDDFRVVDFADKKDVINDFITTVDLGKVSIYKKPNIEGLGTPEAEVFAYFLSKEVHIVKTKVNENGKFTIKIPEELELGHHMAYLIEVYPDGSVSKDLTYLFELVEPYFCLILVLIALILFIFLFIISHYPNPRKQKKKRKKSKTKFNPKKIKKMLKKWFLPVLILLLIPIQSISTVWASVPQFIVYEGRLLDSSGNVITTSHTFRFSLWSSGDKIGTDIDGSGAINTSAGTYGDWYEEQTVTPNSNGTFSFELGTVTSLPTIDYSKHKYLQVEVKMAGDPNTSYELMDPTHDNGADTDDRKTMGSVPYSYVAESAQHSNDEIFALDYDNTIETAGTGSIDLKFGDTLNKILSYDTDNSYFDFNDNVNIQGNITISGTVDGIDLSNLQFTDIATRVKEIVFETEYNGSTVEADAPDNSDNRGKLQIGYEDLGGTAKRNYYIWTTRQTAMQNIDIIISTTLPNDFDSFTATPLSILYKTSDADNTKNKVDVTMYDSTGTAVSLTGGSSLASGSWSTANITFGGSPTFTAGTPITLAIKLSTKDTGSTQVSDVVLEYNGR